MSKQLEMEQRIMDETAYVLATGCTVRQCANVFKTSKSTVHKDLTERLPEINMMAYKKIREILDVNWEEKHIRGGISTKRKYGEVR